MTMVTQFKQGNKGQRLHLCYDIFSTNMEMQ